ncbi:MAG: Chromosomal replication initiator protein DnaA [Verrucomicrobiota bacterium]|jgi:chromosomal replication initiator protein|nr:MAG: chromosomal replication initiator protein DnaA [Verrucomicrobiota bacterium]
MSSSVSHLSLWETAKSELRNALPRADFETWISSLQPLSILEGKVLVLEAPSVLTEAWVNSNYAEMLRRQLTLVAGRNMDYRLTASVDAAREVAPAPAPVARASRQPASSPAPAIKATNTFENFIVGPENEMAHGASLAVAKEPGHYYNPLFIHGPTGLGKTHLMHAIAHSVYAANPQARIAYISSETFTNDFIQALQAGNVASFRRRYRELDLLLIDDIHFLAGKESTQDEFFHTFNELHNNHKQVVLTSDRPASEIAKLQERLVSRFQWGMVASIQAPGLETRIAILRKKAAARGLDLQPEIAEFIASRIARNVRNLEGAVTRIVGLVGMTRKPLELAQVEKLLHDILVEEASHTLTAEVIQRKVAEHYRIQMSDMTSKRRMQNIAFPRQVAMYLATQLTGMSLVSIGQAFGGRDHGTVIHARKTVVNQMEVDANVRRTVEYLRAQLSMNR